MRILVVCSSNNNNTFESFELGILITALFCILFQFSWSWCGPPSPPFDNIYSYGDCLQVKREYYQNCFIYCQRATSSMGTVNKNSSHSLVRPCVCLFVFFRLHDLSLCWCMFCLPWTVESLLFVFWRWRNKLKWAPFELFAPSSSLRVRSWLHPFKGHCEQKTMRDEWVIYVAGHPLLNRRCTRLPGCFYSRKRKL